MIRITLQPQANVGRKWTHWTVEVEVPEGWRPDYNWGTHGPIAIFYELGGGRFKLGFKSLNDQGRRNLNGTR